MTKNRLLIIGLILLFLGPIYQGTDSMLRNTNGDGIIIYGQYTLYRPLIGYKVENYDNLYQGWHKYSTIFHTPLWMKFLGIDDTVTYSVEKEKRSSFSQRTGSFILRWGMKILIPGIFFFFYYRKKKIEDKGYGDLFEI